jgi:anti-anti-sigma regulatory factor
MRTLDAAAPPLSRRKPAAGRVVVVEGDVDALAAARLSAAVCSLGVERVVLDLSGVRTIDAAALGDLLLAARVVGLGVEVVPPPCEDARRLLHLIGG